MIQNLILLGLYRDGEYRKYIFVGRFGEHSRSYLFLREYNERFENNEIRYEPTWYNENGTRLIPSEELTEYVEPSWRFFHTYKHKTGLYHPSREEAEFAMEEDTLGLFKIDLNSSRIEKVA